MSDINNGQDRTIDLSPLGGIKFEEGNHRYSNKDNITYSGITTLLHNYYESFDSDKGSSNSAIKNIVLEEYGEEKFKLLKSQVYKNEVERIKNLDISDKEKGSLIRDVMGHHFLYTKIDAMKEKQPSLYDKFLLEKQSLLDAWAAKSLMATTEGSAEHDKRERDIIENGYMWDGKFFEFNPDKHILNVTLDDRIVIPECLVWNHNLKLGGLADIFLFDKGTIVVQDYKTNEKIDFQSFREKKMLGVCKNLLDTNFSHYSLQLRIYQKMALDLRPEFKRGTNTIIHTSSERYGRDEDTLIDCMDVEKEVGAIFKELENV